MYAPTSITSCCTALIHALAQNPLILVLLGFIGIGTGIATFTAKEEVCSVSITPPTFSQSFAKEPEERARLEALVKAAELAFEQLPTGNPPATLIDEIVGKLNRISSGECSTLNADTVLKDPKLLRSAMKIHFMDIVSTAPSVEAATAKYRQDTRQ